MEKLLEGVITFSEKIFENQKDLFEKLKDSQKPHTLFIGCSDSRVVPNLITNTNPGELFILRNIANIIPPASKNNETLKCSAAILEYAVNFLEVENIVVCGHSNCGGLKALFYPKEKLKNLPMVDNWLEIVRPLKFAVLGIEDEDPKMKKLEKLNVLFQIENLLTYDFVKERVENNQLNIYGWYYDIANGKVYNYNFSNKKFELINRE